MPSKVDLVILAIVGAILGCGIAIGYYAAPTPMASDSQNVYISAANAEASGFYVPSKIVDIHDGDTLTVCAEFKFRVRLLDCWAPELHGSQKVRGEQAREFLKSLADKKAGVLWVPYHGQRLDELFSFGRILGHFTVNGESSTLSEIMVKSGFATKNKETN